VDKNDECSWLWFDADGDCIDVTEVARVGPLSFDTWADMEYEFKIILKSGKEVRCYYYNEEEGVKSREALINKMVLPYKQNHPNLREKRIKDADNQRQSSSPSPRTDTRS
jgi:hypothetical protein